MSDEYMFQLPLPFPQPRVDTEGRNDVLSKGILKVLVKSALPGKPNMMGLWPQVHRGVDGPFEFK